VSRRLLEGKVIAESQKLVASRRGGRTGGRTGGYNDRRDNRRGESARRSMDDEDDYGDKSDGESS